jgi:hypothetical protein
MTMNAIPAPLLRRAMQADALVSGVAGLLLAMLPGPLSGLTGLSKPLVLFFVGTGLVGYALWLIYCTRGPGVNLWAGRVTIALNAVWVAATVVLLLARPDLFNTLGQWLVGIVALVVADFALLQYFGLRRAVRAQWEPLAA